MNNTPQGTKVVLQVVTDELGRTSMNTDLPPPEVLALCRALSDQMLFAIFKANLDRPLVERVQSPIL